MSCLLCFCLFSFRRCIVNSSAGNLPNHGIGGSRISRRGAWTVLGGGEGMDLQHGCFLVKIHVKKKELGPMGGVRQNILNVDPPMHGTTLQLQSVNCMHHKTSPISQSEIAEDFDISDLIQLIQLIPPA